MNQIILNLAYKYVALALMLGEANFFVSQTAIPIGHTLTEGDVQPGSHVGPPSTNDFSGSIVTASNFFGFGWGHLANFTRLDLKPRTQAEIKALNLRFANVVSTIDTNGAYDLAKGWVGSVGVDIPALEQKYKPTVIQWRHPPLGLSNTNLALPIFQVEWRGALTSSARKRLDQAVVAVTVLGTTKELIEFHILDDSLFTRPPLRIMDQKKLLAIQDAEFRAFTPEQRSNFVAQFSQSLKENRSK